MPLPLATPLLDAVPQAAPLAVNVLDAHDLLATFGAIGIAVVLFAETGLLIGFFLPGDSLLFTAGLLCVPGASDVVHLSLWQVLLAAAAGALAGAQTGYWIGRRGGPPLLARIRNPHLHDGVGRAAELLERYGHAKAVVLARFVPVVRTVLNPMAGVLNVPARTFALWQIVGGLVWSVGLVLGGYALGSSVPHVDKYLLPMVALIVIVSLTPLALELYRSRSRVKAAGAGAGANGGTATGASGTGSGVGPAADAPEGL
ncbi:DedA family protein [Streptomyces sp. SID13666]|uniref:DedA family protein n=1 Tax=unclassified Streptomyces TaxID=2593676 RepID=UPI0013C1449A|nr:MULTISPECIES: DedA family protein [unclassified Streptomyces]NEA55734.1 DedA family protein [Streptomyces sp. SID13666]NEA73181.1 DedA family protein [Streptomyces sp. SID13588]